MSHISRILCTRRKMGTNYYIVCKCCGTRLNHLGKQSSGWGFASNYTKNKVMKLLEFMSANEELQNEYKEKINIPEFWNRIVLKDWKIIKEDFS
jgi:hypothetical protein